MSTLRPWMSEMEIDRLTRELWEVVEALRNLREATTDAYKAGRVDALAFVTAGNVLAKHPKVRP